MFSQVVEIGITFETQFVRKEGYHQNQLLALSFFKGNMCLTFPPGCILKYILSLMLIHRDTMHEILIRELLKTFTTSSRAVWKQTLICQTP